MYNITYFLRPFCEDIAVYWMRCMDNERDVHRLLAYAVKVMSVRHDFLRLLSIDRKLSLFVSV